ncbi:MAG: EAL domain-containing protein [Alphaproteobacteria bacterium]
MERAAPSMSLFYHAIIVIAYALAAGIAARFLPTAMPLALETPAVAYGAAVLAGFAILHATLAAARNRITVFREVKALRRTNGEVMRELGFARAEVAQVSDALRAARESNAPAADIREVANEIETLRNEIERLHDDPDATRKSPKKKPPKSDPEETRRASEEFDDAAVLDIVREAIDHDRVDLYLQPIVSLPQRKHRFYECFSRVRDAEGNLIGPERYLKIAEEAGLIAAIDNILLIRCIQLVRKMQKRKRNVGFFINISSHTLADTSFFGEFLRFMAENTDLAPHIVFEFVQADVAEIPADTAAQLHQLGEMGFRFSLDRVGRLDLNYAELSRRYYRYIKFDCATLLTHLGEEDGAENMRQFKSMLESFAIDAIAERVEDESDLIELLDYGMDYGQGYLFGEPRPAR